MIMSMMKVLLFLFTLFLWTLAEEVIIEGSKEETTAIENLLKTWKQMMDEETFEEMVPQLYENNVTLIVNGHKPIKGMKAAIDVMKLWEEWGPGITIKIDEIIVSDSNDFAVAMGTGTYKKVEGWSFVRVLRKIDNEWKLHIDSMHEWVIEYQKETSKVLKRRKRDDTQVEVSGNLDVIEEAKEKCEQFDKFFQAGNLEGIEKLYSKNCVILDNNNQPRKGIEYVQQSFKNMMEKYGNNMKTNIMGVSASNSGDMVAFYGTWTAGNSFGNVVLILKRENGELNARYTNFAHETPM